MVSYNMVHVFYGQVKGAFGLCVSIPILGG